MDKTFFSKLYDELKRTLAENLPIIEAKDSNVDYLMAMELFDSLSEEQQANITRLVARSLAHDVANFFHSRFQEVMERYVKERHKGRGGKK